MRIHYNVTGAEHKRLVNAIVDTIGAKAHYKGMPSAAYEIDYFTVTKDGTLEFSDRSDTEEVEMVIMALEAAGFDGIGETVDEPEEAQETPTEGDTEPESEAEPQADEAPENAKAANETADGHPADDETHRHDHPQPDQPDLHTREATQQGAGHCLPGRRRTDQSPAG